MDGSGDWLEVNSSTAPGGVLNNVSQGTIEIRCKLNTGKNARNFFFYGSESDNMRGHELRANDNDHIGHGIRSWQCSIILVIQQ